MPNYNELAINTPVVFNGDNHFKHVAVLLPFKQCEEPDYHRTK